MAWKLVADDDIAVSGVANQDIVIEILVELVVPYLQSQQLIKSPFQ
jgi:hypothetical protein